MDGNKIPKKQLKAWLGDDLFDAAKMLKLLHELITDTYTIETFKADVRSYDDEDDFEDNEK